MKHVLFTCAGLLAAVTCSQAGAQDPGPIFEIPFGQPLAKPFASCDDLSRDQTDWCDTYRPGPLPTNLYLRRPSIDTPRKIPSWIKDGANVVRLDNAGKVVRIMVSTVGPDRQAAVIESVEGRFGKPTVLEQRDAKNAYGAAWKVTRAEWTLPAVHISHDCLRRDECFLTFETPEEAQRQADQRAKQREKDKM